MRIKVHIGLMFVIGVMGVNGVTDKQLLQKIRKGTLKQRYLNRHHIDLKQLECVVDGETPLTVAIKLQLPDTFSLLLDAGVSVDQQPDGTIPLEMAIKYGIPSMVRSLLDKGARVSPQICRLASNREEMFELFANIFGNVNLSATVDSHDSFDVNRAEADICLENMLMTVNTTKDLQELLKKGVRTGYRDEEGNVALDHAVKNCFEQNTALLLEQDSPAPSEASIDVARGKCKENSLGVPNGCCKTVDVILNGDRREGIYFRLIDLIKNKNLSKYFLKEYFSGPRKLNINRTFSELKNEDALALAVRESDYDAIVLLLWYGAKNVQYSFDLSLRICPKKIIKLLLDHGGMLHRVIRPFEQVIMFNPHAVSVITWLLPRMSKKVRQDAFLFACLKGHVGVAEILLQNGVDIDKISTKEQSALWNSLLSHQIETVELLIAYDVKNNLTPAQRDYMKGYFPVGYQRISEGRKDPFVVV